MKAIALIQMEQERARAKGYTVEVDDVHQDGALARAGICYADIGTSQIEGVSTDDPHPFWPWDNAPKLATQPYLELLIKGAAMIASEIDKQIRDMEKPR